MDIIVGTEEETGMKRFFVHKATRFHNAAFLSKDTLEGSKLKICETYTAAINRYFT